MASDCRMQACLHSSTDGWDAPARLVYHILIHYPFKNINMFSVTRKKHQRGEIFNFFSTNSTNGNIQDSKPELKRIAANQQALTSNLLQMINRFQLNHSLQIDSVKQLLKLTVIYINFQTLTVLLCINCLHPSILLFGAQCPRPWTADIHLSVFPKD